MFLKSFETRGIKGINDKIKLDLSPNLNIFVNEENIEKFGFEDEKFKAFWTLKSAALVGANASGKTSILESIWLGILALRSNSFLQYLKFNSINYLTNVFNKDSILWNYEFLLKDDNKIKKYKIYLEFKDGFFIKEKLNYISINKDGNIEKEIELYNLEDRNLKVNGIQKSFLHNNNNMTIFYLLSSLGINEEISNALNEHNIFIRKLSLFYKKEFKNPFGNSIIPIPSAPKSLEKMNSLLSIIDNSIKEISRDNLGNITLKIKDGKEIKEINNVNLSNFLSEGTINILQKFESFEMGSGSNSIFLIDEIEKNLHSSLSELIYEFFNKNHNQLIFSTHSLEFLKWNIRNDQMFKISKNHIKRLDDKRILNKWNNDYIDFIEEELELKNNPKIEKALKVLGNDKNE